MSRLRPKQTTGGGSLASRIGLAFAAVAALTALLAGVLAYVGWNIQFDRYVKDNLEAVATQWASYFATGFEQNGGWGDWLSSTPRMGMMRGTTVQLLDTDGTVLVSQQPMGIIGQPTDQPTGPVVTAPVMHAGVVVGSVRLWSPGQTEALSDLDEQFRRGSSLGLLLAAAVAVIFATIGGALWANRLSRPIERITSVASAMRGGDREARTGLSGDDEIGVLGRTFDEMADAIEADRELERRLTADVAHELRTPLQAIQATVEAMQDGVLPADQERLGVVRDETVRLARLADGILELTRLERGSMPFEMRPVDVADAVRAAVDTLRPLFEAAELSLAEDIADGIVVNGDPDRLQQAVGNLLSNAARYTQAHGAVVVSVRRDGDAAVIRVEDTGIGISEDDLDRVFKRFWRADDARSRATGGLGIGLSVTREIVERHGGSIGVERRPEGGTAFSMHIPTRPSQGLPVAGFGGERAPSRS